MSIIYDALKKVESLNKKDLKYEASREDKHSKPKIKTYLIYVLVVCVGLFIGNLSFALLAYYSKRRATSQTKERPKPLVKEQAKQESPKELLVPAKSEQVLANESKSTLPVEVKNEPLPSLILNGIFFSEDEGYALINNEIVKVGDVVDGATVKRISVDEVELEFSGSQIKLSTRKK